MRELLVPLGGSLQRWTIDHPVGHPVRSDYLSVGECQMKISFRRRSALASTSSQKIKGELSALVRYKINALIVEPECMMHERVLNFLC